VQNHIVGVVAAQKLPTGRKSDCLVLAEGPIIWVARSTLERRVTQGWSLKAGGQEVAQISFV
jgi:hypothetical protein